MAGSKWATLSNAKALDVALTENFNPGQKFDLVVGLPAPLSSPKQLQGISAHLRRHGVQVSSAQYVNTPEWPYAVKLTMTRPARSRGYAILPLAVLVIGALGAVGIGSFVGFKLGNVVDSLAKNLVPIALIGVAGWIMITYLGKQPARS